MNLYLVFASSAEFLDIQIPHAPKVLVTSIRNAPKKLLPTLVVLVPLLKLLLLRNNTYTIKNLRVSQEWIPYLLKLQGCG